MSESTTANPTATNPASRPEASHEVTVYTSESPLAQPRQLVADIARDLWAGRALAWRMFVRNLRGLYRQTFLGLFWAFLPPLANAAVWIILRNSGAIDLAGDMQVSYAVYVVTGMVVWQSFVEALLAPLQAVQANRNLLSKLKFPRESVLLVRLLEVLFNLGIRLIVLLPMLFFLGPGISGNTFLALIPILFLIMLGFGIGLFLMPFGMLYHDVSRFLMVVTPVWMIVTPIVYAPPKNWATNPLNFLNPPSPLLSAARDLMVFNTTDQWLAAGIYSAIAVPLVLVGLVFYRLSIPILVERIST
ncbi:MAG: ABC transporter permease [Pirellulaceae bacterium]